MTDTEINKALALAIGYRPDQIIASSKGTLVDHQNWWHVFDYKQPRTIWPIAERYDSFPWRALCAETMWTVSSLPKQPPVRDASAAKAVALAVIARGVA